MSLSSGHAIALRYATMIEERALDWAKDDLKTARHEARLEVVAEQNEKLFACHLRLPQLTDPDVVALVASLAGREIEDLRRERRQRDFQRLRGQRAAAQQALREAEEAARSAEERYS